MNIRLRFLLALCCLLTALRAQPILQLATTAPPSSQVGLNGFHRYQLVGLDVAEMNAYKADQLQFSLETPHGTTRFELSRTELRAPQQRLHTSGNNGQGAWLPRRPSAQFRGLTDEGLVAAFTIDPRFIKGRWATSNGKKYNLEPLWRLQPGAPENVYLLYTDNDVKDMPGGCGTSADYQPSANVIPHQDKSVGECFEVEIAIAADFEMFQKFGSAESVENFMLATLMDVQTNYDDEFDDALQYVVVATEIATSNTTDPWINDTDPFELLPDFADWANGNGFGGGISFDVASLWSDRDFDGSTVGLAAVGAVCTNGRFNVLQQFDNSTTAMRVMWTHELGHNFGSFHDPNEPGDPVWIMSPFVSSSTEWSPQSRNAIINYYSGVNCLSNCPVPDPPVAQSSVSQSEVCAGSSVAFFDETSGRVTSREWQFIGGIPATSTESAPIVTFPEPGLYRVRLTVGNQFGADQTEQVINVSGPEAGASRVLFFENFEKEDLGVSIINPDGLNTWFLAEAAGNQGNIGIRVNNFSNDLRGASDVMELPALDLTGLSNPRLEFEYAYQRYSPTLSDRLRVLANTGNGDVLLFEGQENGNQNFATGPDNQDRFVPSQAEDWCFAGPGCISLDLARLGDVSNVVLKIENINGYGNLMWVDNISVVGNCVSSLPVEWLAFTAVARGKASWLDWRVIQAPGHRGFAVERRTNTGEWSEMSWVEATSPSLSTTVDYQFVDADVVAGETYYYRLRQKDNDGTDNLSEVRAVTFSAGISFKAWPNPVTNQLQLQSFAEEDTYQLLNPLGQVLRAGGLINGSTEIDLSGLAAGVYLLRVGEEQLQRIVKQ